MGFILTKMLRNQYVSLVRPRTTDHDLGGDDTAMRVVNWMIEKDMDKPGWIPEPFNWDVHSANPVGKENLNSKLRCYMKQR